MDNGAVATTFYLEDAEIYCEIFVSRVGLTNLA